MPNYNKYRPNVAATIFNNSGKIWIGERADIINSSEWQMPQGGIDNHEEPQKAVIREIYEETGIKSVKIVDKNEESIKYNLPPHLAKKKWNGIYIGQKQKWYLLYFYGSNKEVNLNLHKKPEFKSWKWEESKNIEIQVADFRRDVYKKVLTIFTPKINKTINLL